MAAPCIRLSTKATIFVLGLFWSLGASAANSVVMTCTGYAKVDRKLSSSAVCDGKLSSNDIKIRAHRRFWFDKDMGGFEFFVDGDGYAVIQMVDPNGNVFVDEYGEPFQQVSDSPVEAGGEMQQLILQKEAEIEGRQVKAWYSCTARIL